MRSWHANWALAQVADNAQPRLKRWSMRINLLFALVSRLQQRLIQNLSGIRYTTLNKQQVKDCLKEFDFR